MKKLTHSLAIISVLAVVLFTVTACKSSKQAEKGQTSTVTGNAYIEKVKANAQTEQYITGKLRFDITMGAKDFSLNGTLRMKRNDVIQLSLTFIGMEVGRLEFTQDQVLVMDRFNKQFVRVPYSHVPFLQSAGLDFSALQALFWDELFVPGKSTSAHTLNQFDITMGAGEALLTLTDTPQLNYSFKTRTTDAVITTTAITAKQAGTYALTWNYDRFTQLKGKPFPQRIAVKAQGGNKNYEATFSLSNLSNDTKWNTRTEVPARYKERNIEDILRKMMSL